MIQKIVTDENGEVNDAETNQFSRYLVLSAHDMKCMTLSGSKIVFKVCDVSDENQESY